jgi:hypothetical protein
VIKRKKSSDSVPSSRSLSAPADAEESVARKILETPDFRNASLRRKLFIFLFQRRSGYVSTEMLEKWNFESPKQSFSPEQRIRERIADLRRALVEYAAQSDSRLVCSLPDAVQGKGYRLEFAENDPEAPTLIFWKPHTEEGDVYIVYVEQLFYQDWSRRYLFRHVELNAESEEQALLDLRTKYLEEWSEELNASYPYVAYGEIQTRDALAKWFHERAYLTLNNAVTRRMDDARVWASSLILMGESTSNKYVRDVLKACIPLDIRLEILEEDGRTVGQARVQNAGQEELLRVSDLEPVSLPRGYGLRFNPKVGTILSLLTRVKNRQSGKTVTIFNSEFADSLEQIAFLLTDDRRVQRLIDQVGWKDGLPGQFQILFRFTIDSVATAHRMATPRAVAWRAYPD